MRKRTVKKIALTKETLRSLDAGAVRQAAGGLSLNNGQLGSCNASCITAVTCDLQSCRQSCETACNC